MKKIGNFIYFHKNYIKKYLNKEQLDLLEKANSIKCTFDRYDIIKLDVKTGDFSIITCRGFDTFREPILLWSHKCYIGTGEIKTTLYSETNPPIYHSKHMFVEDDYCGFDIEESKRWTLEWNKYVIKGDKKTIGTVDGWKRFLIKNKLEVI